MITKDGHFLHIDFGHFLGNFKSKFGIRRERTELVLTKAMVEVFGGEKGPKWGEFISLAQRAFLILRKNAALLITCFTLMISCGIPELSAMKDIDYLRNKLMLSLSEEDASKVLEKTFLSSLHSAASHASLLFPRAVLFSFSVTLLRYSLFIIFKRSLPFCLSGTAA